MKGGLQKTNKRRELKKVVLEPGKLKGLPPKTSHIYTLNE